jgi:hypothetical protein
LRLTITTVSLTVAPLNDSARLPFKA